MTAAPRSLPPGSDSVIRRVPRESSAGGEPRPASPGPDSVSWRVPGESSTAAAPRPASPGPDSVSWRVPGESSTAAAPRPASPGADPVSWRVLGDRRVLLLAGRALLLQVMHPVVGAGVTRHSAYAADPVGRLRRTLSFVNAVVYGVPAAAEAQALRAGVGLAPVPLRYRHGPRRRLARRRLVAVARRGSSNQRHLRSLVTQAFQ